MPSLTVIENHIVGDVFTLPMWQEIQSDINYLIQTGADLASAATIVVTNEFHKVTGVTTIDNINHAAPIVGQTAELWVTGGLTIRNNGAGTGNIRTKTGADRVVGANEIVAFVYDGALWREFGPGPGSTGFTTLADVTLGVAAASIDSGVFTTAGYNHIRILTNLRDTNAAAGLGTLMQLNNDATASYYWSEIYGQSAVVAGGTLNAGQTTLRVGGHPGAGAAAGFRGSHVIEIPFASAAITHNVHSSSFHAGAATSASAILDLVSGTYGSATAISRVKLLATTNFDIGSRIIVLGY